MVQTLMAQVTIVITELPDNSYNDSIYISGENIATGAEPGTIVTVAFNYVGSGALTLTRA